MICAKARMHAIARIQRMNDLHVNIRIGGVNEVRCGDWVLDLVQGWFHKLWLISFMIVVRLVTFYP